MSSFGHNNVIFSELSLLILQIPMNACPQMLVEPTVFAITPLDHTDVNVVLQFVLVRSKIIQKSKVISFWRNYGATVGVKCTICCSPNWANQAAVFRRLINFRWLIIKKIHVFMSLILVTIFVIIPGEIWCWSPYQAPVVQKVNSTIHRINHYPLDSKIGFPNSYPMDSDLSDG